MLDYFYFHQNPTFSVPVNQQFYFYVAKVLQADGGNYCACVNAATLALIDAGIPLKEYVIACTASLGNGNVPLIDISHLEESMGGSNLTVAVLPLSGQVYCHLCCFLFRVHVVFFPHHKPSCVISDCCAWNVAKISHRSFTNCVEWGIGWMSENIWNSKWDRENSLEWTCSCLGLGQIRRLMLYFRLWIL